MILLGSYITGPACLRQLFESGSIQDLFLDFWHNRDNFRKDLSPETTYYWDSSLFKAYEKICLYIDKFNEQQMMNDDDIQDLILTFQEYTGIELSKELIVEVLISRQQDAEKLIYHVTDPVFDLDKVNVSTRKTCVKKIEIHELAPCVVKLLGSDYEVPAGQCIYAVASKGRFVLVLPREIICRDYKLCLVNCPGCYASTLHKEGVSIGYIKEDFNDVISFSIINGREMIRVDSSGKIEGEGAYLLSAAGGYPAIYTLSDGKNNNGIVLYKRGNESSDCLLKTTLHGIKQTASYAGFDSRGHLIIENDEY